MRTIGFPIGTTDNNTAIPQIYQRFKVSSTEESQIMRGVQVGIILYNNPAFTSMSMELWSDGGAGPVTKIGDSNAMLKTAILLAQDHALKWVGFSFNYIPLRSGSFYNMAMRFTGYTGTAGSHVAWRISYPDPQYRTGLSFTTENADNTPLEMSIIGGDQ